MHADVIVVGGGLMGCSVAYRLAKDGARVVVDPRSNRSGTRWRFSSGDGAESFTQSSQMSSTSSSASTSGSGVVASSKSRSTTRSSQSSTDRPRASRFTVFAAIVGAPKTSSTRSRRPIPKPWAR
ncbi:MAG: FAD-binding oxidoreductase [Deltaproteobacteria bacterium]|nr:FAD-binding oxidoreductase [Deltaproteobacteria bacterium]